LTALEPLHPIKISNCAKALLPSSRFLSLPLSTHHTLQNNFPERLYRIVIYPSGLVFYGMWNIVQWFLDPVTRQKVCPVMTQAGVLQYIDPSFVAHEAGGTSTYEPDIETMEDAPPFIHSSPATAGGEGEQKE
jgi:hypothetical protein